MSFSPTATRRNVYPRYPISRNAFSPVRRDLSPNGNRETETTPVPNYSYYHNNQPSSPVQPNSRPKSINSDNNVELLKPLLEPDANNPQPPLAGPEIDDLDSDERETVHNNQPGVDDGFFSGGGEKGIEDNNSDAEPLPEKPKEPEPLLPPEAPDDIPDDIDIGTRVGSPIPRYPDFPYAPGYGPGVYNIPDYAPTEIGGESTPDVNFYQHKKTLAQGMMDLALFSANANQLRYVLESYSRHPYYYSSIILISLSIGFQIAVGFGLIWNARYNVKDKKEMCVANKINNFTVIGIFLVTVINVFISAFGVATITPPG